MFTVGPAFFGTGVRISFVGAGVPDSDVNLPTIVPAHNAGDIIVTLDVGNAGFIPSLRSGYTTLCTSNGSIIGGARLSAIADTSNSITSLAAAVGGTMPPLVCVYRGAQVTPGSFGQGSETLGGTNPRNWPNLAAFVGSGSWVIGMLGTNNQYPVVLGPSDTPGMVKRTTKPTTWGGSTYEIFDSNGVLSSFTGYTWNANNPGSTTNISAAAELRRK